MKYTYLHINELGVFYVGCGNRRRPQDRSHRTPLWKQLAKGGYSTLLAGEFSSQEEAWKLEKELIAYFKPICNKAIGGPGSNGVTRTHTLEAKIKMGLANKGRVLTPETKAKMSLSRKGLRNSCKLDLSQVIKIRQEPGSLKDVSQKYGVSKGQISNIRNQKSWSHI